MSAVKWLVILVWVAIVASAAPRTQANVANSEGARYMVYMPLVVVAQTPAAPRQTVVVQVWNDVNGNGERDAGEPGIGSVPVSLTSMTPPSGSAPTSSSLARATDATGTAMFSLINGSTYVLESWHNQSQWRATTETRFILTAPSGQTAYSIGLQRR